MAASGFVHRVEGFLGPLDEPDRVVPGPDPTNGLEGRSAAQCQHIRAVSTARTDTVRGNVGAIELRQIRELLGTLLDIDD